MKIEQWAIKIYQSLIWTLKINILRDKSMYIYIYIYIHLLTFDAIDSGSRWFGAYYALETHWPEDPGFEPVSWS